MFTKDNAKALGMKGGKQPKKRDFVTQHIIAELQTIGANGVSKGRQLVIALIEKAIGGDMAAVREIIDRIEGKAVQINENYNSIGYSAASLSDDELAAVLSSPSGPDVQH